MDIPITLRSFLMLSFLIVIYSNPTKVLRAALKTLLTTYQMIIDCSISAMLINYLSILNAMIDLHGDAAGCQRFDNIFGDIDTITPSHRRLKLIHPSVVFSKSNLPKEIAQDPWLIFYPLVIISKQTTYESYVALMENVTLGAIVCYEGDRATLTSKRPTNANAGFNCFVTSMNPLRREPTPVQKNALLRT